MKTAPLSVTLAQINPTCGDLPGNVAKIVSIIEQSASTSDLIVFPEMSVTGYPLEDLVTRDAFLDAANASIGRIFDAVVAHKVAVIVGLPIRQTAASGMLGVFNAALFIRPDPNEGYVVEYATKTELPNIGQFDEVRIFARLPATERKYIRFKGYLIALQICEDMWHGNVADVLSQPDFTIAINGSPFEIDKYEIRLDLAADRIRQTGGAPLFYLNLVGSQDELVFDGHSFVMDGSETTHFMPFGLEAVRTFTVYKDNPDLPAMVSLDGPGDPIPCVQEMVYTAITLGLGDYVRKNRFPGVLLGMSGGIDSAVAAAVAVDGLGADNVTLVMMPSPWSSQGSIDDSVAAAKLLGVADLRTKPIAATMTAIEATLEEDFQGTEMGVTEENIQARSRGIILMALSNKFGRMVVSTGNKSEMSVGYCTLYGDMVGGYGVLGDVYKMMVYAIAKWRNENHRPWMQGPAGMVIPQAIIDKEPSAELRPDQKDRDSLPPYPVLDPVLERLIENDQSVADILAGRLPDTVSGLTGIGITLDHGTLAQAGITEADLQKVWRLLNTAEYKRRQAPPSPKVTRRNLRRDRRFPITNAYREGIVA